MKKRWVDSLPVVVAALAALVIGGGTLMAQSNVDYIQGRVTSGSGTAEAGVWVIAQTNSLGTPYRKIVVTDDNGAFVIPRLPRATYDVWVRGYGIRDTKKISASPGTESLSLRTQVAGRAEAAKNFPANFWLSMMMPPPASDIPDSAGFQSSVKLGCELCHQLECATSVPIKIRILSSFCHWPSRSSSEPISKNPVAMSKLCASSVQSRRSRSPVQPEMLLSTMKSSPPRCVSLTPGPHLDSPANPAGRVLGWLCHAVERTGSLWAAG